VRYSAPFEQAAEYARAALSLMEKQGIPFNPNNFAVWYHYFSGSNPDLKRALDILLDNKQEITATVSSEIFRQFFALEHEQSALNEAATKLEIEIGKVLEKLSNAGDDAAAYGKTLEMFSGNLGDDGSSDDLKSIMSGVLAATREMEQHNKLLEGELNNSSEEVDRLKTDLEHMRHEATTDALTGIANRKKFDEDMRRAVTEAMEEGADLCLIMMDIDHFKNFNDTYGHQVGDQVLKLLANTLKEGTKGQDTAARYGGEEFAIILPLTDLDGAFRLADNLRKTISSKELRNRTTNEKLGQITVSAGLAQFDMGEPINQFIARADEALYMAKHAGRNRVVSQVELEQTALAFDS
jgi:diguanylate cyclase